MRGSIGAPSLRTIPSIWTKLRRLIGRLAMTIE